ncbi:MAG TPA: molybdate ABC transporter substrate-binding protein, partial [Gaiellaceae bacterium]|nr:molybdate ABC transporter substrate-binding protein [Gaiellaceae bacterium]
RPLALLAIGAAAFAGSAFASRSQATLTVYAAASLTDVLPRIDHAQRYSFAGSNTLAAQIQQGAPADVFASANLAIPIQLQQKGLLGRVYVLARNSLVLIVPRSNPARIHSVYDLRADGTRLVVAAPAVPVGGYTRQALQNLRLTSVLQNVVSEETDVREVLAKVALGEADAGFVYATDARTVPGKVRVFALPAAAQPVVAYAMAVVSSSPNRTAAQAFVSRVLSKAGQAKLRAAGFLARRR